MHAFGSYEEFNTKMYSWEMESTQRAITIGLLLCDARNEDDLTKRIINNINIFNESSGDFINFYIPGYCTKKELNSSDNCKYIEGLYNIEGVDYKFSISFFEKFVEEIKNIGIDYANEPELILVEVENCQVHWEKRLEFPLLSMEKKGKIEDVCSFFNKIFNDARTVVSIDDFSNKGTSRAVKRNIIKFIKDKIPDEILMLCKIYDECKDYRI